MESKKLDSIWMQHNPDEELLIGSVSKFITDLQEENERLKLQLEACRQQALEEAAQVCERYAEDKWALYKGRLANQHVEGLSDGAENCADAIRSLK